MTRKTQTRLVEDLRSAVDPAVRRDVALALLAATRSREKVELALRALGAPEVARLLGPAHRPTLRSFARACFDRPADDPGGLLRERVLALLGGSGRADDVDLLVLGCRSYQRMGAADVLQGLRVVLRRTRDDEVVRYAAVLLATTRLEEDRAFLHRLAREADPRHAGDLAAAVELTNHPDRDALLAEIRSIGNDPHFLARVEKARRDLREGKGGRLEEADA